jgi:hypothetical protein
MLVKIFGIYLLTSTITSLTPYYGPLVGCTIFTNNSHFSIDNYTCDEVAAEINKQIK